MALGISDKPIDIVQNDIQIHQEQSPSAINTTSTPRHVTVDLANSVSNIPVKNAKNIGLLVKGALLLLLIGGVVAAGTIPAVVLSKMAAKVSIDSDNANTTSTTTVTQTTTTVTCSSGYIQTPSGTCVNTQIDFNNCGSIGYVCSSNYTSCSAGTCSTRPAVQLPGAVGVPGWTNTITNIDDAIVTVSLPFSITLYNYSTDNITVSSNGVLCLGSCSSVYSNGNLPDSSFGGPTVFGLWDDLMIYAGTAQSIYYGVSGTAPNRITTFEFYESHYSSSLQYYHFQIIFYENLPNIVKCLYFEMSDGGIGATIGVQSSSSGSSITYSVNQANAVAYNTTIVFDTNNGTFTG